MKKFFRILLWTMVGVIFVGTFVYLYMNSRPKEERYSVVSPSRGDIVRSTVLTGTIEPRDEIEIKPQISGIISEVLVEAGDLVKEGDVIARIKVIPEASQLSSAQNRVDVAQIALDDAKAKYERSKMLFEKKVIAREEFETSEATYERAVKELAGARDAVRIVREGVSELNAKESNTMVRSTISGLVLNVPIKVGSSVILSNTFNDGTTIATVADMNNLIFKGNVDETEVGQLAVGMPMTISIGAMPEEHHAHGASVGSDRVYLAQRHKRQRRQHVRDKGCAFRPARGRLACRIFGQCHCHAQECDQRAHSAGKRG